jgi:uncharacterized protein with PIN domain
MIVDTSALIAILRDEAEAGACARAIENSSIRRISAGNFVESALIIDASRDPIASRRFDDLIKEAEIMISSKRPKSLCTGSLCTILMLAAATCTWLKLPPAS